MGGENKASGDKLAKRNTPENEWATTTTLHGVGKIATSHSILIRMLWVLLFVACGSVMIYQLTLLTLDYLEFNPVTEVSVEVSDVYYLTYLDVDISTCIEKLEVRGRCQKGSVTCLATIHFQHYNMFQIGLALLNM